MNKLLLLMTTIIKIISIINFAFNTIFGLLYKLPNLLLAKRLQLISNYFKIVEKLQNICSIIEKFGNKLQGTGS